jgi:hypothetical protein
MLTWLTGKIAGPVFAGVSALLLMALATVWLVNAWKISDLTSERDDLRASLGTCTANVGTLDASVKVLNGSIDKLAADTKAQNDALSKAMGLATADLRNVRGATNKLLAMPATAPVGSLDACRAGAAIYRGATP